MTALNGQLAIPCSSETGVEFTNTQSSDVTFKFSPSGSFKAASFLPECTAAGIKDFKYQSAMKYPKNTSFALLAVDKKTNTVVAEVGQETTLLVKPGETLLFIINDVPGCYDDNTGSIALNWSGVSLTSKVLQFDGVNDVVDFGIRPEFKVPNEITVEAWIYVSEQKKWAGIISRVFDTGSTESGYGILLDGTSGVYWGVKAQRSGMVYLSSGPNTVQLNKWHHVAGTYDGQELVVWVDGIQKAKQSVSQAGIAYDPDNSLLIGAYKDDNESYYFKGKIAEVRLWNKTRTEQEIKADMSKRLTGKEANLVSYWPLNEVKQEGAIAKVLDLTSNLNGTVTEAILVEDSTFPVR